MTDRIDLHALRELGDTGLGHAHASRHWPVTPDTLLALIDAVQAAHEIQANLDRDGWSSTEADQKLRDTLDRFDFGSMP